MESRRAIVFPAGILFAGIVLACNLTLRVQDPAAPAPTASQGGSSVTPSARIIPTGTATPIELIPQAANWPPTVDELLTECPTAAEIAEVDSTIQMRFMSDPTAGTLVCSASSGSADLTRLQKNAYNAVLIMKDLKFNAPLPWTDQQLYEWFTGAIDIINFRSDIEYPAMFTGRPPTIHINTDLGILRSDRWNRISYVLELYVHEAGHTRMMHTCNSMKDNSIMELGATGIHIRFIEWLVYHGDASFLTPLAPGPSTDYQDALRMRLNLDLRGAFCLDPTPTGTPIAVTPPAPSDQPVWTERMIQAARSGVPAPIPIYPVSHTSIPYEGGVFTWQAVDFPGGVTYGIEIDAWFVSHTVWGFAYWEAFTDAAGIESASFTMPIPFDINNHARGRWRVWAVSPTAGAGPKSEWVSFRIKK